MTQARTHHKLFSLLVVGLLILAACSGDDRSSPDTTSEVSGPDATASTSDTKTDGDVLPEYAEVDRVIVDPSDLDEETDPVDKFFARYRLYVEASYHAAGPPVADPDHEPLQELTTGERAEKYRNYLERLRDQNAVLVVDDPASMTSNPILDRVALRAVEGGKVAFQDCLVNTGVLVNRATGDILDGAVETYLVSVEMTFTNGDWRVSSQKRDKVYEGVSECPDQ